MNSLQGKSPPVSNLLLWNFRFFHGQGRTVLRLVMAVLTAICRIRRVNNVTLDDALHIVCVHVSSRTLSVRLVGTPLYFSAVQITIVLH